MFTGIVEELGTVERVEDRGDSIRLSLQAERVLADARPGDSISVDGCCLTVAELRPGAWSADVMAQTLAKTSLGGLVPGDRVNLERAMAADARLGGHLVQGHVDGVGTVLARTTSEHWAVLEIGVPPALSRFLVDQGSVTVDGVSLTVVAAGDDRFTVSLIPETLARTTLGGREVGDPVNIETDVIARHVARLVEPYLGGDR